jgi:hypothetical protein
MVRYLGPTSIPLQSGGGGFARSPKTLAPVSFTPMIDPQNAIHVFFEHFEPYPVIANAETQVRYPSIS